MQRLCLRNAFDQRVVGCLHGAAGGTLARQRYRSRDQRGGFQHIGFRKRDGRFGCFGNREPE